MRESQQLIEQFIQENELICPPEVATLDLVAEVGELAKEVLRSIDYGRAEPEFRDEVGAELGDALYSLIVVANTYAVDLESVLEVTINKYKRRLRNGGIGSEFDA